MAELVLGAVKMAYKTFTAFREKKAEFQALSDDAEELQERVSAVMGPVLRLYDNRALDPDLVTPLRLMQKHLDKINKYVDSVLAFSKKQQGQGNLKTVAVALAENMVGSLPEPLQQVSKAMLGELGGAPHKQFDSLADKMNVIVNTLTLAVTTQALTGSRTQSTGGEGQPPDQATMGVAQPELATSGTDKPPPVVPDSMQPQPVAPVGAPADASAQFQENMGSLLMEDAAGKDVTVHKIRSKSSWVVWGIVLRGKPYIFIVNSSTGMLGAIWFLVRSPANFYDKSVYNLLNWDSVFNEAVKKYIVEMAQGDSDFEAEVMQKLQFPLADEPGNDVFLDVCCCMCLCTKFEMKVETKPGSMRGYCKGIAPDYENHPAFVVKCDTQSGEFTIGFDPCNKKITIDGVDFDGTG